MRILIAAGGSGGHIYPGIAIAHEIRRRDPQADIVFVGTRDKLESKLVPREGFPIRYIDISGFRRKLSMDTFRTLGKLGKSWFQISRILKEVRPDAVIGTGGYVSGPVLLRAALAGIPTLVHESNALPGVTTKLLARAVDVVAVGFQETAPRLHGRARISFTGNPVRADLAASNREEARKALGIGKNEMFVVIYGGSLGSATLNRTMTDMIRSRNGDVGFRLQYATGMNHAETVSAALEDVTLAHVEIVPYIWQMDLALAAADLAVTRSGAMTVGELCALGVPSILIPSPHVAENHQEYNARSLENRGAAVVILENQLTADILHGQIHRILSDRDLRQRMSCNASKLKSLQAATVTVDLLEEAVRARRRAKTGRKG